MHGRRQGRVANQDPDPTEKRLRDDQSERGPAQAACGGPRLCAGQPDGQNERQDRDDAGDHAMCVFEADPADHRRNQPAIGERPVRNRVPGVVVRYQRARHDKQDGRAASRYGKTVTAAMSFGLGHDERGFPSVIEPTSIKGYRGKSKNRFLRRQRFSPPRLRLDLEANYRWIPGPLLSFPGARLGPGRKPFEALAATATSRFYGLYSARRANASAERNNRAWRWRPSLFR